MEFKIENMTNREVFEKYQQGISEQLYIDKMGFLFDKNIIAIPEKSTFDILVDEILNPFNLFQVFVFSSNNKKINYFQQFNIILRNIQT